MHPSRPTNPTMTTHTAGAVAAVLSWLAASAAGQPAGGFTNQQTTIVPQVSWSHADCPRGSVVRGFCSSGADAECHYNGRNYWALVVCEAYAGLVSGPPVDFLAVNGTIGGGHLNIASCPVGYVLTGLCNSGSDEDCVASNGRRYYTVARCSQLAPGLLVETANSVTGWQNEIYAHTWGPPGHGAVITTATASSSIAECRSGYVAVSACSTGRRSSDCTGSLLNVPEHYFAHVLCIPLPTASPTASPTAVPSASPTAAPTMHHCSGGTHGCDDATTYCAEAAGVNNYTCECLANHEPIANDTFRCRLVTDAPTVQPTAAPTATPTSAPTPMCPFGGPDPPNCGVLVQNIGCTDVVLQSCPAYCGACTSPPTPAPTSACLPSNPCLNGGICSDLLESELGDTSGSGALATSGAVTINFECACVGGFSGPVCDISPAPTTGAPTLPTSAPTAAPATSDNDPNTSESSSDGSNNDETAVIAAVVVIIVVAAAACVIYKAMQRRRSDPIITEHKYRPDRDDAYRNPTYAAIHPESPEQAPAIPQRQMSPAGVSVSSMPMYAEMTPMYGPPSPRSTTSPTQYRFANDSNV